MLKDLLGGEGSKKKTNTPLPPADMERHNRKGHDLSTFSLYQGNFYFVVLEFLGPAPLKYGKIFCYEQNT